MDGSLTEAPPTPAPECRKPAKGPRRSKLSPKVQGTLKNSPPAEQQPRQELQGSFRKSSDLKGPKAFASSPISTPLVFADAQPPPAFIPEIDPNDLACFESVGEGVTAEVFRGSFRHGLKCESVAIKKMYISRMQETERLRFSREISVLARLVHSNLTLLHGVSFNPLLIVTEFCSGGPCFELLHNMADSVKISWPQRHTMCEGVASAMQYLHGFVPPIIHRDLKSLNILLASPVKSHKDPVFVKVTDFGLARMQEEVDGEAAWGKMTRAVGTVHWMAPEVLTRTDYNEKADVYSFSIFCYEVLCRDIPFADEEPATIARKVTRGGRPSLDSVPSDAPTELVDLMTACWAHKPHHRPTFDEIAGMLEAESGSTPVPQARRKHRQTNTV